jgi:hypothetical protein
MGILSKIGGSIKQGGRLVQYKYTLSEDRKSIKYDILDLFKPDEIKQLCRYFNIGEPTRTEMNSRGEFYHPKPNARDWIDHAMRHVSLEQMKEYAIKKYKNVRPIIEKENRLKQIRLEKFPEYEEQPDNQPKIDIPEYTSEESVLLSRVIEAIEDFKPARQYKNEFSYHIELNGYLKAQFPEVEIEVQKGRSRPDIAIGEDICIEVKGPTRAKDLTTIADKCIRYLKYYPHLIVVLFEVQVNDVRYKEWYEGISGQYEKSITIIRK